MRSCALGVALCGATLLFAPLRALAADHQPAAPVTDAAGPWTLESDGRPICVLDFGKEKISAASFALTVPMACGDALPSDVVAWTAAANGVRLVGFDDSSVMGFSRSSDDVLVSRRSDGMVLQLERGDRNP